MVAPKLRRIAAAPLILALTVAAGPRKSAPEPARAIDLAKVGGRWYEIARTPNPNQKDCEGATTDWNPRGPDAYEVVQTCHKGEPAGPARVMKASAVLVDKATNAKWKLSFFGGVLKQEYWLVDRADDHSWMLFGTPGGNYIWILSRRAVMPPGAKAEALQRCRALGYDTGKLVFPRQIGWARSPNSLSRSNCSMPGAIVFAVWRRLGYLQSRNSISLPNITDRNKAMLQLRYNLTVDQPNGVRFNLLDFSRNRNRLAGPHYIEAGKPL